MLEQIEASEILDEASFQLVAKLGLLAKKTLANIEEAFKPARKQADETHKTVVKLERKATEHYEMAEARSKEKVARARDAHGYEVEGASFAEVWRAEVTDERDLPREYLMPDYKKIQGIATALKGECRIPGVKVFRRTQVSYRTEQ